MVDREIKKLQEMAGIVNELSLVDKERTVAVLNDAYELIEELWSHTDRHTITRHEIKPILDGIVKEISILDTKG